MENRIYRIGYDVGMLRCYDVTRPEVQYTWSRQGLERYSQVSRVDRIEQHHIIPCVRHGHDRALQSWTSPSLPTGGTLPGNRFADGAAWPLLRWRIWRRISCPELRRKRANTLYSHLIIIALIALAYCTGRDSGYSLS